MATKTERILELLPATFVTRTGNSPLDRLARTYGGELQGAENAMAAIMRAHWVDQADLGAERIDDLARIAALYGLAPQPDDGIEEFRRRLKLWVALLLDGPATVRGLLRAVSVILGIEIDDRDAAFDAAWLREGALFPTSRTSGRDASKAVMGFEKAAAQGRDAVAARIVGRVRLGDTVDLTGGGTLRVGLDGGAATPIDLAAALADLAAAEPADIVDAINVALGAEVAALADGALVLTSPSEAASGSLAVVDGPDDAAPRLLGLAPRVFAGSDAVAASYASPVDLSSGVDLGAVRFVRLRIDGTTLAEIDLAGAAPESTSLDELRDAINGALAAPVAAHDGQTLTLTSPTAGAASSIAFLTAAAQDASQLVFGPHPTVVTGRDAAPASVTGTVDLSRGADLGERSVLAVSFDGAAETEIDCAGAVPENTQLPELVAVINAAAGTEIASHNGRNLILSGKVAGPGGSLTVGEADAGDASGLLLGLVPRTADGADATGAEVRGAVDLSRGIDLSVRSFLRVATDFHPPVTLDLAAGGDASGMTAADIAAAIVAAEGGPDAAAIDERLVLRSPSVGAASALTLEPVVEVEERRFLSRVPVVEEAARAVFGFASARAEGQPARAAELVGTVDVSRGVDLRGDRFLRIAIDGAPAVDIDCAGPRPRTTSSAEIVARINAALGVEAASVAGRRVVLRSPTSGAGSRVELQAPQATDAAELLLGVSTAEARGRAATRVSFVGTADLSAGVDLSGRSHLRLSVDDGAAVEIDCAGPAPSATTLGQIAIAINIALGINIASHDGAHVLLTSPTVGTAGALEILAPAASDATETILGISPERSYRGAEATAARITGLPDRSGGVDVSVRRFLRLKIDAAAPVEIDCASTAGNPVTASLDDIAGAINAATGATLASHSGGHLVLASPSPGASSRVLVEPTTAGDAREAILGAIPDEAEGAASTAATLVGEVDLRRGVDLSQRSALRIGQGAAAPEDVDLAGEAPAATSAEEIVSAIDARFPGMATLESDGRLRLTSTAGDGGALSVLPIRYFEVVEFPPVERVRSVSELRHADRVILDNTGAVAMPARLTLASTLGVAAPSVVDLSAGTEVTVRGAVAPGGSVTIVRRGDGVALEGAEPWEVAGAAPRALALPLAPHLDWPLDTSRGMATGTGARRQVTITHPEGDETISVVEIGRAPSQPVIGLAPAVAIPDASAEELPSDVHLGRLRVEGKGYALFAEGDARIAGVDGAALETVDRLVGTLVAVKGPLLGLGGSAVIVAEAVRGLLDLRIVSADATSGDPVEETHSGIVLAAPDAFGALSVVRRLNWTFGRGLVRAEIFAASDALTLSRGKSARVLMHCLAARFDHARFNAARFAGGPCLQQGVFDVSRFAETPRAAVTPVFAPVDAYPGVTADVEIAWHEHEAGAAEINLPLDLPPRFGARFNMDRFAIASDAPESVPGLTVEPPGDPDHFAQRLEEGASESVLVSAKAVDTVPIGFSAVAVPFARPRFLAGGRPDRAARLFLVVDEVPGFIEISSLLPGEAGTRISVVVRDAGPGLFDMLVAFDGARFENARARVAGEPITGFAADLHKPGPRGVLTLKAAGVRVGVTRTGTPPEDLDYLGERDA